MLERALLMFFIFGLGFLFGVVIISVLSANSREEEINRAYELGYKDCMQDRPPRIRMR